MRAMVAFRISRGVTSPRRISAARARASWSSSRASIDKCCSVGLRSLSERFAGLADARARFLPRLGRGRVGHTEARRQAAGLALALGDTDSLPQVGDEHTVGAYHVAAGCLVSGAAG